MADLFDEIETEVDRLADVRRHMSQMETAEGMATAIAILHVGETLGHVGVAIAREMNRVSNRIKELRDLYQTRR